LESPFSIGYLNSFTPKAIMKNKVLVTGFQPFNNRNYNPSELVVSELQKKNSSNQFDAIILPVSFGKATQILKQRMISFQPDIVLSLGLAENRDHITIEKKALNKIESTIPDNDGAIFKSKLIDENGEQEILTTIPISKIVDTMKKKGYILRSSDYAGTYVCNFLMYTTLAFLKKSKVKFGFIHLPPISEKEHNLNGMSLNEQLKMIDEIILLLGNSLD
jgi:pyroglutamyl-peptidase